MRPEARDAWLAATQTLGNPSSIHGAGQASRKLLEDARERLARTLDADPIEIVFTSGGTESINLALKGGWWARQSESRGVVLPDGEHHAVMDTVEWLRKHDGAEVRSVALDETGSIRLDAFASALEGAALATAIVANNEVGTINDVASLAALASQARVPLHLDAVAAFGHVPLSFHDLGVAVMSVSGHKIGGAPGTGALVTSRTASLAALHHGGAAQRDLRAGTLDVAGAVAFAAAAEVATRDLAAEEARIAHLRDELMSGIEREVGAAEVLGSRESRLAGNVHVLFPDALGESLLYLLDREGIAVSTGSACQAGIAEASHVVQAMGRTEREARSVLRFSLGRTSSESDVSAVLRVISDVYRQASGNRS